MGPSTKKALKIVVPIALGVLLILYSYYSTTPDERRQIIHHITHAKPLWVILSVAIGIVSHLSRAIRWNYLLKPLGYSPKLSNNILIILMAYFANLGVPRSGEFLRATALTTYEGVPFEKGFGTIVTERLIDVIMLLLIILIALALQTDIILDYLTNNGINLFGAAGFLVIAILGLVGTIYLLKNSEHALIVKIKNFLSGLLEGVLSISRMQKKWPFIFHTLLIWVAYIAMFWVIKYTVPETVSLSLSELLVGFVAGAFAMSTTNGGIGLYPIAVSTALSIYGVSEISGDAFGWIMWISQTLMVVVFGAISFFLLPLLNRNT